MEVYSMLEQLPFTAVEVLAKYCSPQDLAVCCAISSQMRDIFGENLLWRRHCTIGLAEYLKNTPCKVQPPFVSPEPEHSTLSPISSARLDFMLENHLWNNWRLGRNTRQEIVKESETHFRFSIWDRILSNDYVMSYIDGPKRIEIFDVRETPLLQDLTVPASTYNQYDEIHAAKNRMCLVKNQYVEVRYIDFETKQSAAEHVFFYDKDVKEESTSSSFLHTTAGENGMSLLIGSTLVAVKKKDATLHIWDVEAGLKIRKQNCHLPYGVIEQIRTADSKLVLNVSNNVQMATNKMCTILVYDLHALTYQPFKLNIKPPFEYRVCGSFVAILSKRLLNVFNYNTSETVMIDINIGSDTLSCFKNSLIFIENNEVKVCDPSLRQIIKLPINDKVRSFQVLSDRFLQVTSYHRYELIVWEFQSLARPRRTRTRFDFEACSFFLNKACTRYIVRYGSHGTLIHFW